VTDTSVSWTTHATATSQWGSSAISAEYIQHLVERSKGGENPWTNPVLGSLVDRYYADTVTRMNYYKFLNHLVREQQPAVAVELGVEFGLASAHMASAAYEYGGKVIGVDRNRHEVPERIIPETWPNTYTFIHGDTILAADLVEAVVAHSGPIGVLFQDSSHHYAPSCQEWDRYRPLMAKGGIWICDDITPAFYEEGVDEKSMVAYFKERPGRYKMLFPNVLHYGNTVGVILL
jgi:predicted O-methyltransferase YrrM